MDSRLLAASLLAAGCATTSGAAGAVVDSPAVLRQVEVDCGDTVDVGSAVAVVQAVACDSDGDCAVVALHTSVDDPAMWYPVCSAGEVATVTWLAPG